MQLHYLWIKDYKNIKEQGFNLSSKYIFDYSLIDSILVVTENPEYIHDFFGSKVSNITAIVGENGTGKSNILDLGDIAFFVAEYNNVFYLVNESKQTIKEVKSPFNIVSVNKMDFDEAVIIKYSNHFEGIERDNNSRSLHYWNFSTDALLKNNYFSNPHEETQLIKKYKLYETFTQSDFILTFNNINLPFNTPESIDVSFSLRDEYQKLLQQIKDLYDVEVHLKIFSNPTEKEILESLKEKFIKEIVKLESTKGEEANVEFLNKMALFQLEWSILFSFINAYPANSEGSCIHKFYESNINWRKLDIDSWIEDFFYSFLKEYQDSEFHRGEKYYKQIINWSNNIGPFLFEFKNLLSSSKDLKITYNNRVHLFEDLTKPNSDIRKIPKEIKIEFRLSTKKNFKPFQNCFYELYRKIIWSGRIDSLGFLNFDWRNMSTGERNLLSLFSRIHSLNFNIDLINKTRQEENNKKKIKNLIIMLDEADIGLHPNWQRTMLNQIIKTLEIIFKNISSTQIIIATHSPFLASDLPLSNLIFLQKNKDGNCSVVKNPLMDKKQTFASNIHTLFTDSFFMKDGLIGEFAKEKINNIIDDLMSSQQLTVERKIEIKKTITLVGEPLIKRKLIQLYEDKYKLALDNDMLIMDKRITDIEKKLNDKNKKQ